MLNRTMIFVLISTLSVGACAVDEQPQPTSQADRDAALRESAFGGLVEPMDRAQAVQQLQIDRKRELDAAIEN